MTMFGHRKGSGRFRTFTGVPGVYRNPPGSVMGLLGLSGEEEGWPGQAACPLPLVQFGLGLGGARPALGSPSLFPVWPNKAQYFSPANSRNSPVLR